MTREELHSVEQNIEREIEEIGLSMDRWREFHADEREEPEDFVREYHANHGWLRRMNDRLLELQVALRRIREGGYGVCEECGEDIAVQRLRAAPAARHCIACARAAEGV